MDKNAIKKYAVWARRELIEKVTQKAQQFGVEDGKEMDINADSVNGVLLTDVQKKQRQALIQKVKQDGVQQVMEEVAYTWFNRFIALRFMEVNGYLPSHVRVFTDDNNAFKPQILSEALHLDLPGLDMDKVYAMKEANQDEELFKYLLIVQCNDLNSILPGMFQKIADYTELLLPDYLLREGSVIEQMITMIPQEDWTDQVQIIGWLYQYYNTEPKDQVFADLKKNKKITKEKIPAATQLFTPDWIVRYMVENSLGRLWLEGHPDNKNKFLPKKEEQDHYIKTHTDDGKWHYYLEEAEQEPDVQKQLDEIHKEYSALKPEDIRCIDPCMGSGHILCYLFDALVKIYEDYGYSARDAATSIVEHNLWGLDIDDRAAQLAYFAVMMKARRYDRRFFVRGVQPHIYAIAESNQLSSEVIKAFLGEKKDLKLEVDSLIDDLYDAKEYGSIIKVRPINFEKIRSRIREIDNMPNSSIFERYASEKLLPLVNIVEALSQKYHVVVTNPPYMAPTMEQKPFLIKHFKKSKNDLAMVFMEQELNLCNENGFCSMINFPTWMFLSSYESLRKDIIRRDTIVCMVYAGRGIFGSDFGSTCFVLNKKLVKDYRGQYRKLFDSIGEVETVDIREEQFLNNKGVYTFCQSDYSKIPASPLAFWISDNFLRTFSETKLGDLSISKAGIVSGNDDYFLRMWFEININDITFTASDFTDKKAFKWVPINKGGAYRQYYGNYEYVINIYDLWNDSSKVNVSVRRSDPEYYFKKALSWSSATMGRSSFRISENKTSSTLAPCLYFGKPNDLYVALGLLNSNIAQLYLDLLNPTVSLNVTNVSSVPAIGFEEDCSDIVDMVQENIALCKEDWDQFETSWDFKKHPLIRNTELIEEAWKDWNEECNARIKKFKRNQEQLNRKFIQMYGLDDEVSADICDDYIALYRCDEKKDIRSFISYAVGCMFGRYSLDRDGVIFAGGDAATSAPYVTYLPDKDGIIPISEDEYFGDDIVNKFIDFVSVVYGQNSLERNLKFIADALGSKGSPREIIRRYFLNEYYKDHCSTYSGTVGKRPIYWLFDSGNKNGFKCLIYMHRYQPDTIARIRTDYVHEQQSRYRTAIEETEQRLLSADGSNRVKLNKKLKHLKEQDEEIHIYEEKIHHLADQMISIDLDDGVKHNYAIFQDVLAKIK